VLTARQWIRVPTVHPITLGQLSAGFLRTAHRTSTPSGALIPTFLALFSHSPQLVAVQKRHSFPIASVRRKRQRLPSRSLIENASVGDILPLFNVRAPRRFRSRLATVRSWRRGSHRMIGRCQSSEYLSPRTGLWCAGMIPVRRACLTATKHYAKDRSGSFGEVISAAGCRMDRLYPEFGLGLPNENATLHVRQREIGKGTDLGRTGPGKARARIESNCVLH
jgi:hypothetical protein